MVIERLTRKSSKNIVRFIGLSLIILVFLSVGSNYAIAQKGIRTQNPDFNTTELFRPGELLVKFKASIASTTKTQVMSQFNAVFKENIYGMSVQVWKVPEGKELDVIEALNQNPLVEYAEPNYIYHAFVLPNDPGYPNQWGLTKMHAPSAWDISTGSAGVTIAIIDTGIDETHPDLAGKIVAGHDFIDGDSNPHDLNGHGTHVAGIAAAITNNSVGVAGANWGASIMPIRVLQSDGTGFSDIISSGIEFAVQHGAKVINLSLGGKSYTQSMQNAINEAHATGVLVIAAMGNERDQGNSTMYPAAYNNVLAVSATTPWDTYAYYSNYGMHCDIAAPGGEMGYMHDKDGILSTLPTYSVYLNSQPYGYYQNYDYLHGTSQASPYVSGLAGLILSVNPSLSPDEVQGIIQSTAVDLGAPGWDQDYGYGRINMLAALEEAKKLDAPTIETVNNPDGDGNYLINWNDVLNATSYRLQEDDNSAFTSSANIYEGVNSQYSVSGRGPGTWYYRVKAINASASSNWSSIRSVTVKPNPPNLDTIDNIDQDSSYTITWSSPKASVGFTLQEDDNASFSSPLVRYSGVSSSYIVTGQAGGTWYYRVRAYNCGGDSDWSSTRQAAVDPPPYDPPVLNPISNDDGDGTFTVQWTQVVTATGYILEKSSDEYFADTSKVFEGSTLEKAFSDVTGGTWHYRVRAKGPDGKSAWSNPQSVLVVSNVFFPIMVSNYSSATSFDSQFNGSIDGWEVINGTWIAGANYLSTPGIDGQWVSISYPLTFMDFDYQVKMKRSGCNLCATTVLVRGNPDILVEKNHWYSYYAFQYHNPNPNPDRYPKFGGFSVYKRVGGIIYELKEWTDDPAINTGNAWNTVRVLADGVNLYYYINGSLVWSGVDTSLQSGKVGIAMYQEPNAGNLLQVDWATLTTDISQSNNFIGEELLGEGVEAIPALEGSEDMDFR